VKKGALRFTAEDRGLRRGKASPPQITASLLQRQNAPFGALRFAAEDRGFEPLRAFTQLAFQASAIGH